MLHLFLGLPSSLFPSTTTLHTFFCSPPYMPHALPPSSYLISSPKQNLRNTNHVAPHYAVLSITCHFLPLRSKYLPQHPLLKTPPPTYCPLLCNTKLHGHTKQAKYLTIIFLGWKKTFSICNVVPTYLNSATFQQILQHVRVATVTCILVFRIYSRSASSLDSNKASVLFFTYVFNRYSRSDTVSADQLQSPVTTDWHVLRSWMNQTVSQYEGYQNVRGSVKWKPYIFFIS